MLQHVSIQAHSVCIDILAFLNPPFHCACASNCAVNFMAVTLSCLVHDYLACAHTHKIDTYASRRVAH
jgi:hypothetical protein